MMEEERTVIKINEQTPRCLIRFLEEEDYDVFVAGYRNCLPSKNQFDEGQVDVSFLTREWYSNLLKRRKKEADNDYCYMFNVFRKEDGCSIGYCDITTQYREDIQYAKIGYTIFNNYWNSGFATEVVKALTRIGFEHLNFHRLEAHINITNPASKAVVLKCGYAFESIRSGFIYEDGEWTDNEIYYINNGNWRNQSHEFISGD